ncbi:shikimate dehydrogenase family protein [Nakamurella deserti]|uniref:shikimate dehydrogenase family protein n=1 Tax=Nakamurella deserti TaxID=2164074 RepID=UPI001478FA3C|nr:shikimate dehydrogenase [Nakamurella deserti]
MISGTTRTCFVVADPVHHLRTPTSLNRIWEAQGDDAVTVAAHVTAAGLSAFLAGIRVNASVLGTVVTVPHKENAAALCDELGPNARLVGAVNVVRRTQDGRLVGETFDGLGFVAGLRAQGIEPEGQRVVVVGAGGAASAVAVALLSAGVRTLDVSNRTAPRAASLVERLHAAVPSGDVGTGLDRLPAATLVINATSAGLHPADVSPLPAAAFPAGATAADVVMSSSPTPFLAAAAAAGLRTHEGIHMLAGQTHLIAQFLRAS